MKKIKIYIVVLLISLTSFSLSAQNVVTSFLDKHGKDDNLEVVSIGKKMFEKMESLSSGTPELMDAIKGLENIYIVSSTDLSLTQEYYDSAYHLLSKSKGFEEISTVKDNEKDGLTVMIKESKGIVKELVLLSGQEKGFNLIALSGDIDLKTLAEYSQSLNIEGLDKLGRVEKVK